jgi:hypothetical protein
MAWLRPTPALTLFAVQVRRPEPELLAPRLVRLPPALLSLR